MIKANEHSVATYTMLCVLKKMRDQMGLEAMIEYLEKYLCIIEEHNPQLKMAVKHALTLLNVEKIYKEARVWNKEQRDESL